MRRSAVISIVSLAVVACGGGTVTIGKMGSTDEQLQKTASGGPTGNGTTCSFTGTTLLAQYGGANPTYNVGEQFASPDGCNTCHCTGQGIMCTVQVCAARDAEACPALGRLCANGQGATSGPNCALICPEDDGGVTASDAGGGHACSDLAMQCPDGTYVGPSGPNCDFVCPTTDCTTLSSSASSEINAFVKANQACSQDTDCVVVENNADCVGQCGNAIRNSAQDGFNAEVAKVNANQCAQFHKQSCSFAYPPCAGAGVGRCLNSVCSVTYP